MPPPEAPPAPPKRNQTMLYLGVGAGCLLLLIVGFVVVAAVGIFYAKARVPTPARPTLAERKAGPPPEATKEPEQRPPPAVEPPAPLKVELFLNSRDELADDLRAHYFEFLCLYPAGWSANAKARQGGEFFIDLRGREPESDTSAERFTVGIWLRDPQRPDRPQMEAKARELSARFGAALKEYHEVSVAPGGLGGYQGMELIFSAQTPGGQQLWGRSLVLQPQNRDQTEAPILHLLATDVSKHVHGTDDVGVKGGLPLVVNTFRWGTDHEQANGMFSKLSSRAQVLFALLDLNGDNALSGAELLDGQLARFDRNSDGRVTREEFEAGNPSQ